MTMNDKTCGTCQFWDNVNYNMPDMTKGVCECKDIIDSEKLFVTTDRCSCSRYKQDTEQTEIDFPTKCWNEINKVMFGVKNET